MILKNFFVFEGIDGSGTSTQINILKKKTAGQNFLYTAEPTSTETGRFLRKMLKGEFSITNETAAYLFAADRNEHINGVLVTDGQSLIQGIKKACNGGKTVISDRYLFSSLAYQSISCPREVPRIANSLFPLPQLLFFFDISPSLSLARVDSRGETREIYEKEDFLNQVVTEYKTAIKECSEKEKDMKVVIIDATKSIDEISSIIWTEIQQVLAKN